MSLQLGSRERRAPPRSWQTVAGRATGVVLSASLLLLFVLPLIALLTFAPASALLAAAGDPSVGAAVRFTLLSSGAAVAISLGLGVPLGYLLARYRFPGRSVVASVVTLPLVVPHLIAGLALLFLFAPNGWFGRLFPPTENPFVGTFWAAVLVMTYVSASYTVLASELAFRSVDPSVREAAQSLGASPSEVLATVTLPLALRGILSGALLTWARSVSEIGGFLVLAYTIYPYPPYPGPVTNPVSVFIYNLYQGGNVTAAAAVSSIFLLIAFVLFLVLRGLELRSGLPSGVTAGEP